jgi:hydroxyethylthiazole kinase-like sugar kinase family protein
MYTSVEDDVKLIHQVLSRGVDSVGSGLANPGRTAAIVVLTGENDYISDGNIVLKASNGHDLVRPLPSEELTSSLEV